MHQVLIRAHEMILDLLTEHREEIRDAYLKAGEDTENDSKGLTVSIGLKILPGIGPSQKKISADLSFVKDRCKDSKSDIIDENQPKLPRLQVPGGKGKKPQVTPF